MSSNKLTAEDVEAYRKNYDLCKKYMFYANREMNCKHPNCPAGGCRISFTPDLNQSIGTVEIPCDIIEGFKPEEVVWNEEEKVGQRQCSTATDKYWYIEVIEMSMKSQKNNKYQPAYKIRSINERQLNRRVRAEIQKNQKTEQCQIANGAGCKFEDLRKLKGEDGIVDGKYLNHLMPYQGNMQEIVDANVLSLMHIKSEQMMPTNNLKQEETYTPAIGQYYEDGDNQFQSQEAVRKTHPLASSSYYNLSDVNISNSVENTPANNTSKTKVISNNANKISRVETQSKLADKQFRIVNDDAVESKITVSPDNVNGTPIPTRQISQDNKPSRSRGLAVGTDKLSAMQHYYLQNKSDDSTGYM